MKKIALMFLAGLAMVAIGAGLGYVIFEKPWVEKTVTRKESRVTSIPFTESPITESVPDTNTLPFIPPVMGTPTFDKPIITDTATSRSVTFPNATFLIEKLEKNKYGISLVNTEIMNGKKLILLDTLTQNDALAEESVMPKISTTTDHNIYTWISTQKFYGGDTGRTTFVDITGPIVSVINQTKNFTRITDTLEFSVVDRSPLNTLTVGFSNPCIAEGKAITLTSLILNNLVVMNLPAAITLPCVEQNDELEGTLLPKHDADWLTFKGMSPDFSKAYITFQDKDSYGRAFPVTIDMYRQTMTAEPTPNDIITVRKQ